MGRRRSVAEYNALIGTLVDSAGPLDAEWMIVGEGPGVDEAAQGEPFVGLTGQEMRRYFDGNELPPFDETYHANVYRIFGGKDYEFTDEDLQRDEPFLLGAFAKVEPKVIVAVGRHATRYFLGDVSMDEVHGLPWYLPDGRAKDSIGSGAHGTGVRRTRKDIQRGGGTCGSGVVVFPTYHPAAGFRSPEASALVSYDFAQLALYAKGALTPRILHDDPIPKPQYLHVRSAAAIETFETLGVTRLREDSEGYLRDPWSIQFTNLAGTGYMITREDLPLISTYFEYLVRNGVRATFHSALHDRSVRRAFARLCGWDEKRILFELDTLPFDDTMVMAYLLQLEPQGLKGLATRHANMAMQSFDEMMGSAQQDKAIEWLQSVWDCCQFDYEDDQQVEFTKINNTPLRDKAGKVKRRKADGEIQYRRTANLPKVPKSDLFKSVERCMRAKEPFKLWNDQREDIRVEGYRVLADMPRARYTDVEFSKFLFYGCRDTDATTRVEPELENRIDAMGLRGVYNLELGTYPLIDRMQTVGMKPDLKVFKALSSKLDCEIADIQVRIEASTGLDGFNANSGDQVAEHLFRTLNLPSIKMTSGGKREPRESTNDKILEALEKEHGHEFPIISDIRDYRETYKLKHTFVDRVPDFVHRYPHDGRVHATFRTTRVITGRLAASDPNILAQPEHGKFAKDFKAGWVAEEGHVVANWDMCLVPGTRVLKADLTWVPIESLKPGDDLIGTEENASNGRERKTLTTQVVHTGRRKKHCFELELSNGKTITASDEHPWLVRRDNGLAKLRRRVRWVQTQDLVTGDRLSRFVDPWEVEETRDAGWLAGFFDGEGSLSTANGTMTLTQNPGPLMEKAKALLRARGYDFHVDSPMRHPSGYRPGGQQTEVIWMCGVRDCLHFLGTIRPERLLAKRAGLWEGRISLKKKRGKQSPCSDVPVTIVAIRDAGVRETIPIETTSHTFVAEGFHTHNSQVELRVLAHLSKDPVLCEAYLYECSHPKDWQGGKTICKRNECILKGDLHARLAKMVFGLNPDQQDDSKHRLPAKTHNFGLAMGMTCHGLMIELRKNGVEVDEEGAQEWIDASNKLYKKVPHYKEEKIAEARRNGYVRCLSGRIRYIGGIRSRDERLRAEAERFAFSTPVQEGAQRSMKEAETYIWNELLMKKYYRDGYYKGGNKKRWVEPLCQVHDALKFEVAKGLERNLNTEMCYAMTKIPTRLIVPLGVEGKFGSNFASMIKFGRTV